MIQPSFTWFKALAVLVVITFQAASANQVLAQMVQAVSPAIQGRTGFFESTGVRWNLQGPNFFAQFPGWGQTPAGVGVPNSGFDPNSGLRTGFGFSSGRTRGAIGLSAIQGRSSTLQSTAPSLTTTNGIPGAIHSQTIRPFVTGVTPIVTGGGYGQPVHDNVAAQAASAYHAAHNQYLQSRLAANIRAQQRIAEEAFERGLRAEADGNLRMARANYRNALRADTGPLRLQIFAKLQQFQTR
ncbi:hypothetical protein [Roseiconus lacunae]|uniref:hypothetical protein n=1 Tax=Roseiconus lacunae TaxID=2605694 RepID=UPI001E2E4D90|nr:hypothetical protein [Roseiconus lacunae]MCD0461198.1 hypothetical protein [Roseiconus lacunae]